MTTALPDLGVHGITARQARLQSIWASLSLYPTCVHACVTRPKELSQGGKGERFPTAVPRRPCRGPCHGRGRRRCPRTTAKAPRHVVSGRAQRAPRRIQSCSWFAKRRPPLPASRRLRSKSSAGPQRPRKARGRGASARGGQGRRRKASGSVRLLGPAPDRARPAVSCQLQGPSPAGWGRRPSVCSLIWLT